MNAFEKLLQLPPAEGRKIGVAFTAPEIAQQPAVWLKAARDLSARGDEIRRFLADSGLTGGDDATLILAGAGTSEFIGNATMHGLRCNLSRLVLSVPTTHIVTHPSTALVPGRKYAVVHFARSGDSPESLATYRFIRKFHPAARHIVITCNRGGALVKAAGADGGALCIVLPDETNDRSLVMTSSFSTMALTALGLPLVAQGKDFEGLTRQLAAAARRILDAYGDLFHQAAQRRFNRACFLGSNALLGTMQECHLKMKEMTESRVVCRFESFLGLRHGPQVFVNDECMVFAALSSDPYPRQYEMDMLRQLKANNQGAGMIVLCDKNFESLGDLDAHAVELFPDCPAVPDIYRVVTDVVAGQLFAMFKCISLGLKPDNPSASGTITRVVKGVTIYEPQ
ncbi:MAG: hypothetical protein HZA50_09075 [Planctomycetes bacterium]|nr:hypothetical protein [Planctomycetota bacterium]